MWRLFGVTVLLFEICWAQDQATHTVPCAMPMCMPCPHGYVYTQEGCMTCECKAPQPETTSKHADVATCSPVSCTMFCKNGFQKDARGCDLCKCRPAIDDCATVFCGYLMKCKMVKPNTCPLEPCEPSARCVVPSMCEMAKKMTGGFLADMTDFVDKALGCGEDGSYQPKQCNPDRSRCWCVDDRGVKIPSSEWSVIDGVASNRTCSSFKSSMAELSFELEHDIKKDDIEQAFTDIKQWVRKFVSARTGMKQERIVRIQITLAGPGRMAVEVDVVPDGLSDLPSAVHNVIRTCKDGSCRVRLGNHNVHTNPKSMFVRHKYNGVWQTTTPILTTEPTSVGCGFGNYGLSGMGWILLVVGGGFLLVAFFITIVCVATRKKKPIGNTHTKLKAMDSFKKNLILNAELEKPDLGNDYVSVSLAENGDTKKVPL